MGIGDWLGDKVNQIGDAVEDAAETATAKLGEVVDDVLDVGADAARGLGWDSLGETLDDVGDHVSSALGGEVEERELGETEDPKELIRGEPSAITEAGTSLGKLSTAADQTGEGLRAVGNISDWEGLGADGYQVGFSPQPGKWTDAADAFTDAKTALEAWAAAVSAAQGVAADAITQWNAAVHERRRVLARWNSLSDEEKAKTTVVDTWTPMFQAARDTLARARTNRDTAAAQAVTAIAAAKASAPEEPPFISRMGANLEDLGQIGDYAKLSFADGFLTAGAGLVQFVRQLNPTDIYNLTHPGEYLENVSNLAGGLAVTAADPGPVVDAMIDDAKANPFEALGALTFDAVTAIPTGGAGLATKPVSLLNKVDNLVLSGRPTLPGTTRAPGLDRTAPDGSSPPANTHPDTTSDMPQGDAPGVADQTLRDVDAPPQDRGASAAPEPERPDTNVQATLQDQSAPEGAQPSGRDHTDDGGVDVSGGQPSPDAPAARPDTTVDTPGSPADQPSAGPSRLDDPATPGTRPDSDPPATSPAGDASDAPAPDHGSTPDHDSTDGSDPDTRDSNDHEPSPEPDNQDGQPDSDPPTDPSDPNRDVADAADNPANTQTARDVAECGDPVDAATGEFLLPETDLTLPGVLPLVLKRRHRSNYRWGRWFGPTWSSTLDMRVVVDDEQVTFVGEDGLLLAYPHADPGTAVPPLAGGVRYTCVRTDIGTYRVADPEREIVWHFAPEPALDGLDTRLGVYAISAITDRHRNRIRFHYNTGGAPTAITHSGGYHVEITTDPAIGRITAFAVLGTSHIGRILSGGSGFDDTRDKGTADNGHPAHVVVRRFAYVAGNLAAATNGVGATTRYTYDDGDRMLSWTDSRGTTMVNTYDSAGRVILQHGTDGILNAGFDYLTYPDGSGRLTRHINSQGAVTTRGFDHDLRVRDITDPLGGLTRVDYNPGRRPLRVTAPDNTVTHYAYTPDGDVTRIVRPDGLAIDIEYAWRNRPETITQPDGSTEHREWDAHGNLTATINPGGIRTTYSYHANGAVATIAEPNTARTAITVDAAGLPITVTDPLGATTHIDRDGFGRPIAVTDPLGHTTRYQWSPEGKLLHRLDPDGHYESWAFDGEGNLLTHTNRAGGITQYAYGSWDLLIARTDPDGSTTRYTYDTERRLTAVINPLGHVWHFRYDSAGRLTSQTDYNDATTTYTHDLAGRLATVTPATGIARQHRYDQLGRLTEITADSGHWRRYTHDPLGRLLTATSGNGDDILHALAFAYTPGGQLSSQTLDAGTPMRFEYDQLGRRDLRTTPSGAQTRWRWDWSGRPTALDTDGHTIGFAHNPAGQLTEWTIGELAITHDYDPLGRLERQTVTGFPARLSTLALDTGPRPNPRQLRTDEYTWRPDGYITNHTTRTDRTAIHLDYELDPIGRINTLTRNGAIAEHYAYDALSNITDSYTPSAPAATVPEPIDTHADRTTQDTRREYGSNNLLIRHGRTRYHYDASGRLIRKTTTRLSRKPDVWHYRYDDFDQLTDVWTPDHQWWHYTYDALGRRTTKQHLATNGTVLERIDYTWDATVLVEQAARESIMRWHYRPDTHTPLTQTTDQASIDREFYAIITDLVGTPTDLIDPIDGQPVASAVADLWGRTTWQGRAFTPLQFPGQIYDQETGLHYNLYRVYDPHTGRFLTQDPLGLRPAPNPGNYPHNPLTWIDPLGLACKLPVRQDPHPQNVTFAPNSIPEDTIPIIEEINRSGVIIEPSVKGPDIPKTFNNDGRAGGDILPTHDSHGQPIVYREWGTVPAPNNPTPGSERIVTGSDGSVYYTPDHYRTFIPWNP
ncbi:MULTISPECIES: putative T7SS-secreted protein [unclassified Nocardia]|uniref:putative T7SS-secreted protein n=1 Tax=unclassified Nocardia TaxID=2637762 RepID=UPI00278C3058|nr:MULTISPECIES: DUF6531 domain-containing protein [unclassified Nocardia]